MGETGEIRKRVLAVKEVNVLPRIALEIEDAAQDALGSILKIEELIRSDVALSVMILKMANSAYYGNPKRISSIEDAVTALGLEEVTLLALGVGAFDATEVHPPDQGFDLVEFWIHCFSVSWLAEKLSLATGKGNPGEVATAALLHDLGKLVITTHLQPEGGSLKQLLRQGREFYEAEALMELDHSRIGFWLARKWGLPESVTNPIRDHHGFPAEGDLDPATAIVILANGLAKTLGFGLSHKEKESLINPSLEATGLVGTDIKEIARKAREQLPPIIDRWRGLLTPEDN